MLTRVGWVSLLICFFPLESRAGQTIRYHAIIDSVESGSGKVTIRHYSTGHNVDIYPETCPELSLLTEADLDEVADGTPIQCWVTEDRFKENMVVLRAGLFQVARSRDFTEEINFPSIRGIFVQRPVADDDPANAMKSRDGKNILGIKIAGKERVFAQKESSRKMRSRVEIRTQGAIEDFQVGREIQVEYTLDTAGKTELRRALVLDRLPGGFPYYMNEPAGPSGVTAGEINENLEKVAAQYEKIKPELEKLMPVKMRISHGLVNVGEATELKMEVLAMQRPNPEAMLILNHILENPEPAKPVTLNWKESGRSSGMTRYIASVQLPTATPGQHLIIWKCDIGGDIDEFYRNYAVVTPDTAICTFQVNNMTQDLKAVFDELKIPFHLWVPHASNSKRWKSAPASQWAGSSRMERRTGASAEHGLMYMVWDSGQIREDPPDVQRAGLSMIKTTPALLGFPYDGNSFWHYTMGTETVNIARELGFQSVSALCTEMHVDGSMGINHFGHPERPYFVSKEDFRKPEKYADGNMIGLAQVQRHTLLAREYRCGYNPEPGNGGLNMGAGGRKIWDEIALSRVVDAYDAFFQMQASQKVPLVIQLCLEFSGKANRPGATEGNRYMPRYAVQKARDGQKVVFANSRDIVDYYMKHYEHTPETISYQHDYWAAFSAAEKSYGVKPVLYPDFMQIENHLFMSYSRYNDILPTYHYDYTKVWDYPDFGNENIKRKRDGTGVPADDHDRYAVTPKITDTRKMEAKRKDRELRDGTLEIKLQVKSDEARREFPLALFDIPRTFEKGDDWFVIDNGRFVPIKAPYSGNLNGFAVVDLKKGITEIRLSVSSKKRVPVKMDIDWDDRLSGKVFFRQNRYMAYVGLMQPWTTDVELDVPVGKEVVLAIAPQGELRTLAAGTHLFTIPKGEWARIIGMSRDELKTALRAKAGSLK